MTEKQQLKEELSTIEAGITTLEMANDEIKQQMLTAPYEQHWIYHLQIEMNEIGTDNWPWQGLIGETPNIESLRKQHRKLVWKLSSMKRGADTTTSSGTITDVDIAEAKTIPLQNFYDGDKLRKVSGKLWGRCPFHNEKSASFAIYLNQNTWWCYGSCGTGGDVIDFIRKKNHCDFIQAVRILLNK
jgi:hypothetical protein